MGRVVRRNRTAAWQQFIDTYASLCLPAVFTRYSCHEPCHACSKGHHLVGIPADQGSAPRWKSNPYKADFKDAARGHYGPYLRLCPHSVPNQPH
jgi:hypothetical protein